MTSGTCRAQAIAGAAFRAPKKKRKKVSPGLTFKRTKPSFLDTI